MKNPPIAAAFAPRLVPWLTVGVLIAGLTCTTFAALTSLQQVESQARTKFERLAETVTVETQRRVNQPVYGLKGARGVYAASEFVKRREFAAYVASRDLASEFPGTLGFGFVERVSPEKLEAFVMVERADDAPAFRVKSFASPSRRPDSVAEHLIIKHVYPLPQNERAWGLDIATESVRRQAAARAIESGNPTISGRVTLVQDGDARCGFLYFVPVYRNEATLASAQDRRENLVGLLYAPIVLEVALEGIVRGAGDSLDLEIYDGEDHRKECQLFDYDGHLDGVKGELSAANYGDRQFVTFNTLFVGGRKWTLVTSSTPHFEASISYSAPLMIAGGGAFVSLLMMAVVWSLCRSRCHAEALAESITRELRAASREAERLAEIARRTSNAVIITDADGVIEWVNEGFTRISGYSLVESKGRKPGSFLQGPNSDPEAVRQLGEAVRNAESATVEIVNYAKDGREYWISIEIAPLRDESGQLTGFMAIESDITELKRSSERAEAASRTKSEFLANMSHEIRTPLTAILGCCDILREDGAIHKAPPRRLQTIDTIRRAGDHLLTVINDILDLSKIEAGRFSTQLVDVSLPSILSEVESFIRPRVACKSVALSFTIGTPIPDRIVSDPTHLRQILLNLLGNAAKFTEAGCIDVRVEAVHVGDKQTLRVGVRDSGSGMSPEQASLLFRPFTQADASVTRKYGGTGLGLTISRRLAEFLEGSVTLQETSPGAGSLFVLELPLVPAAGSTLVTEIHSLVSSPPPIEPIFKLDGRILLAEDSPEIQRLLEFHLKKAGAEVTTTNNGVEALERLDFAEREGRTFDLLLTDMQMPEMDGYTLAETLRSRGCHMPIIALTAHAMAEDRQRCLDAGCDDYVSKPIDKAQLLSACGKLLTETRSGFITASR